MQCRLWQWGAFLLVHFDVYALRVSAFFEIGDLEISYDAELVNDLGLDSIQFFQLLIATESWAEAIVVNEFPDLRTVGDAYDYYTRLCAAGDQVGQS